MARVNPPSAQGHQRLPRWRLHGCESVASLRGAHHHKNASQTKGSQPAPRSQAPTTSVTQCMLTS